MSSSDHDNAVQRYNARAIDFTRKRLRDIGVNDLTAGVELPDGLEAQVTDVLLEYITFHLAMHSQLSYPVQVRVTVTPTVICTLTCSESGGLHNVPEHGLLVETFKGMVFYRRIDNESHPRLGIIHAMIGESYQRLKKVANDIVSEDRSSAPPSSSIEATHYDLTKPDYPTQLTNGQDLLRAVLSPSKSRELGVLCVNTQCVEDTAVVILKNPHVRKTICLFVDTKSPTLLPDIVGSIRAATADVRKEWGGDTYLLQAALETMVGAYSSPVRLSELNRKNVTEAVQEFLTVPEEKVPGVIYVDAFHVSRR